MSWRVASDLQSIPVQVGRRHIYVTYIYMCVYVCVCVYNIHQFSSVQSLSHVWLFATPWTAAHQASLFITNSQSLLKLMSIELVMPSNHLILCGPLLLLPSIFPRIRVFSNESVLRIRWPKYWSFSFSISPSNEYSGLISFKIDWFDLLAVKGPLKSLLQHHSSKAPILQHSTFFIHKCLYLHMGGAVVKNPPANAGDTQETWVESLSQKDPLEEEVATYSSILAWEIPWTEEPGGL